MQNEKTREKLRRKTHLTIKKVTEDIQREFHFNTAISAIMELVNEIGRLQASNSKLQAKPGGPEACSLHEAINEAIEAVVILLSPFVPHIAEELWQILGRKESIFKSRWPSYDKEAIRQKDALIVVQVNGKVRAKLTVSPDTEESELKKLVLQDERVTKWIGDKPVKKFFVVANRLVSIVV